MYNHQILVAANTIKKFLLFKNVLLCKKEINKIKG